MSRTCEQLVFHVEVLLNSAYPDDRDNNYVDENIQNAKDIQNPLPLWLRRVAFDLENECNNGKLANSN